MTKHKHTGIPRARTVCTKEPALGYYVIFTDTEATETCYFRGLRDSLNTDGKREITIKVFDNIKTEKLVNNCLEKISENPQFAVPWIVFDRDKVPAFDAIIADAKVHDIHVGWSNPCFEVWLYGYFGTLNGVEDSVQCCRQFGEKFKKVTHNEYVKSKKTIWAAYSLW
ncbi:MAG: RloB family protein [Spirochaetia bacterium]|jgi:hypothetical protein|nr:RloB family protein [Spirochaetia bacterium]